MKAFWIALSAVLVVAVALVAIIIANRGGDKYLAGDPAQSASPSTSVSVSPSGTPASASPSASPTPYSGPVDPLTGLPADASVISNRPYAIMINNLSTAQPQLGISKADIIYEILVEGGITRMMAIFQDVSQAGEIGSIRSARPYFVDIANGYDAVYIHAGGSPDAYTELKLIGITHLDGVNGGKTDIFYRDKSRLKMGYEHSLVSTSALIQKFLPTYGVRLVHNDGFKSSMTFSDKAAPAGGLAAESVTVHFSSSKTTVFTYSDADKLYYITQYKKDYIDGNDKTKVGVTNVLVLKTRIKVISGDDKGRIDVDTVGSGTGIFICGGKYEEIKWSRKNNSSQFVFTREDGKPLVFGTGKTYVCVADKGNAVDFK
ncbi:Protein of unknown function [Sporobacter termitidis DSM 10068]|uniref:DUF3048 domain-containing protein n=1 Tax=Sporobacter termitidis DSM 10068 TaxID=1123282 RepID=A0A1M5TFA3_9FIRM|nr:DUF3048 domain-containing protein [Sporobacter termitidis]SHH49495.1 Protein of unknown function [Sporobacter termitidis DSM 10068]